MFIIVRTINGTTVTYRSSLSPNDLFSSREMADSLAKKLNSLQSDLSPQWGVVEKRQ